jgi:hypothetical protein
MPNESNRIQTGKPFKTTLYKDAKGRYWQCEVLSGTGPYTIRIPSRVAAGMPASQHTLTLIPLAANKTSTNAVHPSVRMTYHGGNQMG